MNSLIWHRIGSVAWLILLCFGSAASVTAADSSRARRILYNLDGDSCLTTRAGATGAVNVTRADLKRLVDEVFYPGSQVDTMLICVNAQVLYYPTRVGTQRGTRSSPEERAKWPAREQLRFATVERWTATGVDPYAELFAEVRRRGKEAFLSFRMNDDHGNDFLRTRFWEENPDCRLGQGALDFGQPKVRSYVLALLAEALDRYEVDGVELDFNRFPRFFRQGKAPEAISAMNELVEHVRQRVSTESTRRGRRLQLSVRVPSNFGRAVPTPASARDLGCDIVEWVRRGWVDFVTVSEFLFERGNLPMRAWKAALPQVPVYGGIECTEGGQPEQYLTAAGYRRAAKRLWDEGVDGVYLFNFFTTREHDATAWDPPFEVLAQLGHARTIAAAEQGAAALWVATPVTAPGSFTPGIEGPACDASGQVFAVNYGEQQTIGRVTVDGRAGHFVRLPGISTGNGIRFDRRGYMFVADYVGHNVLVIDPRSRAVSVFAHHAGMNQPNDLAIGPDETLYASDPNWKDGTGQLWRIDRDGTVERLAEGLGTTNGIEVSPDGRTLYVNESVQRGVWAFPITPQRRLGPKRLVRQFADYGFDGMRCDVAGNLFITRHGKGTVVQLSPNGEILREVDVLGSMPSNLCFGGSDGRTCYVTEVQHARLVQFRVERPGAEWQRWQP